MKPSFVTLVRIAPALALVGSITTAASADDSPAGYARRPTTTDYVAPLSQTTQPSYVPQSVALSGPTELAFHEGEGVPPGYTPVQRPRRGAIIAGAVVFGSLYSLSLLVASANDSDWSRNESLPLCIPLVGPFIQLASSDGGGGNGALMIDGLGQTAGFILLAYGLASSKTVLVRNDLTVGSVKVQATPVVTGHATGVGLAGTF